MIDSRAVDLLMLEAEEMARELVESFFVEFEGGRNDNYRSGLVLRGTGEETPNGFELPGITGR